MSKKFQFNSGPLFDGGEPRDFALSTHEFGPNTAGETTQRYVYGTRYITWDGRVFKYMGLTTGGCVSYHGVQSTLAAVTSFTTSVAAELGATDMLITDTGITEDQLAGAFIELYKATIDNSTQRQIIGNDATVGSTTRIYLEFPLSAAMTTSDSVEVFENPYRLVSEASATANAWMGAATRTASSGENIWAQTWGPCIISPGNTSLDDPAANERSVYWWNNGTIAEAASSQATSESQHAGYILNQGSSGIAGPIIYLMCST